MDTKSSKKSKQTKRILMRKTAGTKIQSKMTFQAEFFNEHDYLHINYDKSERKLVLSVHFSF